MNCAQKVLHAAREKFPHAGEKMEEFAKYGGGRAPEGHCGAFYAAKVILGRDHPEKARDCERHLVSVAGSTKCGRIRAMRRLSCQGCVEAMTEFIAGV